MQTQNVRARRRPVRANQYHPASYVRLSVFLEESLLGYSLGRTGSIPPVSSSPHVEESIHRGGHRAHEVCEVDKSALYPCAHVIVVYLIDPAPSPI